jgi:hypothetical protein
MQKNIKQSAAKEKFGIVLSAPVQGEVGGKELGGMSPAEPEDFRSDFFKYTSPVFTFCKSYKN